MTIRNADYSVPLLQTNVSTTPSGARTVVSRLADSSKLHISTTGYTGKRLNTHPLPVHAYHLNVQDFSLIQNFSNYQYADGSKLEGSGGYISHISQGVSYIPTYNAAALEAKALDKLTDKVRGDLDLSIDLAEAHQTARMINATSKVADYTRVFTRRFGALKTAGNAFLEYTYGVKPLVQDVYAAADENIRIVINKTQRIRARAVDFWTPTHVQFSTVDGTFNFPITGGNVKFSISYGLDMSTDQWDPARWSSLNPVSIAWEILPYSFVADWFLNVGGYLRNLETYLLYANKFRSGYKTVLAAGDVQVTAQGTVSNVWPHQQWLYTGRLRHRDITRTLLSSYPCPALPSFNARLGSSRLLSAASLFSTLLKSGGNPVKRDKRLSREVNRTVRDRQPKPNVSVWPPGYIHL